MSDVILVIGDKNISSWSMRPWLALRHAGIPFQELNVTLRQEEKTKAAILPHSPSGQVPVVKVGGVTINESLAICEWAAEHAPHAGLWPDDWRARAMARAAATEMHNGFPAVRRELSMDILGRHPGLERSAECEANIARILDIWTAARAAFGQSGPFLFGRWSVADAMYAPVVTRFITYDVPLPAVATAYVEAMMADAPVQEWIAGARAQMAGHR
jgi:glutathione S-transferase